MAGGPETKPEAEQCPLCGMTSETWSGMCPRSWCARPAPGFTLRPPSEGERFKAEVLSDVAKVHAWWTRPRFSLDTLFGVGIAGLALWQTGRWLGAW